MGVAVFVGSELEGERLEGGRASVFECELEAVTLADEVGAGVGPGVQVGAAAQRLTELGAGALADVVDDGDGGGVFTLEVSELTEEGRDVGGAVFVEMMEAHEGIEQDEPGLEALQGGVQTNQIVRGVEEQTGSGDDVQVERLEGEATVATDAGDAAPDLVQRILCEEDEARAGLLDLEAIETRSGAGNGDGDVETEPGFAAFGSTGEEADRLRAPQGADEPRSGAVDLVEVGDPRRREKGV